MSLLWKLGGMAVALAAVYFLITMYGGARYKQGKADEASAWTQALVDAERGKLAAYQNGVASVMNADKQYIETVRETVIPVTKTIIERASSYAQTADGAGICLDAERVFGLEQTTGSLFSTPTATPTDGPADGMLAVPVAEE